MIKFFRKYEKYIFWGIVAVILPAFPISGVMMTTCGRTGPKAVGELYGRAVMQDQFELERQRLGRFQRVIGRTGDFNDQVIWDHLAFLEQAERAGIDVSDEEVATEVTRVYKDLQGQRKAIERIRAEFGEMKDQRTLEQIYRYLAQEESQKVAFDFEGYQAMLKQADVTPSEFERTFRELLRIQKLQQSVVSGAQPDVEKLYDAYQDQNHRRKAVYVAFRAQDYPIGATASAEELRKHYDRNMERFREPSRVSIEWVSVSGDAFEKEAVEPTDAELQARYEAVKARYRIDAPTPASPTAEGATPTAVVESYRPFADVKAGLATEMRSERKLELAARKAESLRATAAAPTGTAVSLATLASGAGAKHGASGLVEELDLIKFPDILFWNLLNSVARLTPQAPVSEVARHDAKTSAFFLRLVERRESAVPTFEAARAKVEESYLRGLDDDLRKYHAEHADKYKTPVTSTIEYVHVPYARLEKQVPEGTTGTARAVELRKKAEARLLEVRQAAAEKGADGKPRDLESAALDKGAEHGRATVEDTAKELAAAARSTESLERLRGASDKIGELSPIFESEDKTGVFFYVVRQHKPETQLTLADARERVRKDLLDDRAFDRARDAAETFAKEIVARPETLRAVAAQKGHKVAETAFVTRKDKDKVEGVADAARLVNVLFGLPEVGAVSGASHDQAARVSYVVRWAAKEPAPVDGFAEARKELLKSPMLLRSARDEAEKEWHDRVLLEAQGVDEDVLKEVYSLRYGPEGLASVEASQIYIGMDQATIKTELGKRAKRDADAAAAEVKKGARFDNTARTRSQDGFRKRGGDTGFWKRGSLPRELAGLTEVESTAFALRPGEMSEPFETRLGWHLVQSMERRGAEEIRIRHMLFRSERAQDDFGNLVPLDADVEKLAFEKAKEKAEKAQARLTAGEDFTAVAKDLSDEPFLAYKREYEFQTGFERDSFAQTLGQISPVLALDAERWQLILADDGTSRADRERQENNSPESRPRMVRRIEAKGDRGKRKLEQAREDLLEFQARLEREDSSNRTDGRGRSSFDFRKKFEDMAKDDSDAPSGARGGRVGIFRPDPSLVRFGAPFRDALFALKEGETSQLVKSAAGYHIIRVVGREKKTFDEARRDVADALLDGLTF